MYHRVWDWIRWWLRCRRWCGSRRLYRSRGYLPLLCNGTFGVQDLLRFYISYTNYGTATGGGAEGVSVNAFAEVMRGGAGNILLTGSSPEDDKPDAELQLQSAGWFLGITTSSCCMASACSWSASQWTYCVRWMLLNACRKEYSLKQNRFR